MRILLVLATAALLLAPRIADACGYWRMTDEEKQWQVGYHITSATITNSAKRRVAALHLDADHPPGMRVVKNKKVIFDIKGDTLTRYGKKVATFDATSITFGKRVYTIALSNKHEFHGPAWDLVVKRGDTVVITSTEASALCEMAKNPSDEAMQAEIRRRVMFYLAWRETGV